MDGVTAEREKQVEMGDGGDGLGEWINMLCCARGFYTTNTLRTLCEGRNKRLTQ
jgi:hypothetical protein